MQDDPQKTIVEINGVKLEVDLRYARRVEELRIGDRVKVLRKEYSSHNVFPGVIVGFEPFKALPTIVVAYLAKDYAKAEIKFLHYNAASKSDDVDIVVAADEDFHAERDVILKQFDAQIATKRREIEVIEEQRSYFETNFRAYWSRVQPAEVA